MSAATRPKADDPTVVVAVVLVLAFALALFLFAVVPAGQAWSGHPMKITDLPAVLQAMVNKHSLWTSSHTAALICFLGVPAVLVLGLWIAWLIKRPSRHEIDKAAIHMGTGKQVAPLLHRAVAKKAKRMGVYKIAQHPGILLGKMVHGAAMVYASFEDTCLDIWGQRAGKSSTRAIPAILAAPGPVLATSNKPDLVDATAARRALVGKVYRFDPQGLLGNNGDPTVFFNPLASIKEIEDAKDLAKGFEETTAEVDARKDAFFSPTGEKVVSDYLLAAAVSGEYLPIIFDWVNNPTNPKPANILRAHGYEDIAERIEANQAMPDKTRGGIYGEARRIVSFLESRRLRKWLCPGEGREEFDPVKFVTSTDTLYLLSQEGSGSAGPIIAALVKAVFNAGEAAAANSPTTPKRLPIPLIAVLDEAANICRIRDLPEKYSHYGSKGILPMTLLQSYEQGQEVWGDLGMGKLWASSNVKIYGGNNDSVAFLSDLEKLIGTYEYKEAVVSYGKDGKSTSYQNRSEDILSIADLRAMPEDRMLIFAGSSRPALARTLPWYKDRKLARQVKKANKDAKQADVDRKALAAQKAAVGKDVEVDTHV